MKENAFKGLVEFPADLFSVCFTIQEMYNGELL